MTLDEYKRRNSFMTYNGIEPVSVGKNHSEIQTELRKEGKNLSGYAHGGLLATMADCAAGMAVRGDGRNYVTQNMNITYISNIQSGQIFARGEVIHRGRRLSLVRIQILDGAGKLLAEASVNMFCTDR